MFHVYDGQPSLPVPAALSGSAWIHQVKFKTSYDDFISIRLFHIRWDAKCKVDGECEKHTAH